ncbi:DNA repair protein RadA [Psittacicella hinzii]|uniref:DNA repair protein RadA n=1 Tax=Psittacicella hinzii TaxID=2028575 RepID=A0A3A1YHB0_9GAMM|nr:DNA repair protein RadA [Psittacicella hinzii]RIY37075.1 DNA repair protein RadA [Psittacicella hinzii]
MSKKDKIVYVCSSCGFDYPKWEGKCRACGEYGTLKEFRVSAPAESGAQVVKKVKPRSAAQAAQAGKRAASNSKTVEDEVLTSELEQDFSREEKTALQRQTRAYNRRGYAGIFDTSAKRISQIEVQEIARTHTGFGEFDRVLGGGLVPGSAILVGGHPGAGKSTILLQIVTKLSKENKILYVTGEESLEQVKMRAERVGMPATDENLLMLSETSVDQIINICEEELPNILIIDSIQVMSLDGITSSPGSVSQVRESAAALTRYAKQTHTSVIMVGHVTKDGTLAGPKVLEHVIDCSLMIEAAEDSRFRIIRSTKNRFGAVNEIGVFMMDSSGLHEVKNPSAIFLSRTDDPAPGSAIVVLWEGSRPLIVEIQSLVDNSNKDSSRRISNGFDNNRLQMLLAIMAKHGGIQMYNNEVYVNVVGGIKVQETSADLAVVLAILSSSLNKILPRNLIVLGELGLSGELRPVAMGQERLLEASRQGFNVAIIPASNKINITIPHLDIRPVKNLKQAFAVIRELLSSQTDGE